MLVKKNCIVLFQIAKLFELHRFEKDAEASGNATKEVPSTPSNSNKHAPAKSGPDSKHKVTSAATNASTVDSAADKKNTKH